MPGLYAFDDLPALQDGQSYTVTITPPAGYEPTVPGAGTDRAVDSSTGSTSSWMDLTTDGARDMTLDFGFVKPVPPTTPPTTPPTAPPTTPPPGPPIPPTGMDSLGLIAGAAGISLLGAGLLIARRFRLEA